jgi:hypothetical protein
VPRAVASEAFADSRSLPLAALTRIDAKKHG